MISIQHLTLKYFNKILLENFTADILPGECIGIFGPNGAGKSTFLKGLLGKISPASGQVLLNNRPIVENSRAMGYLPQELDNLFMDYTVFSFLRLLVEGYRWGIPWISRKERQRCEAVLQQVNAIGYKNQPLKKLSGGEKKRVILAALLLETPKVLLLDEPLANLDPRYQTELLKLIEELQKKFHFTLLITAHDFNPLLYLLDRVMFIGQGKAVLDLPDKVIQSSVLSDLYNTPLRVIEFDGRKWVLSDESLGAQHVFFNPLEHCHGECHVSV